MPEHVLKESMGTEYESWSFLSRSALISLNGQSNHIQSNQSIGFKFITDESDSFPQSFCEMDVSMDCNSNSLSDSQFKFSLITKFLLSL